MASVQQLEKLHQIQSLFYASDSLEAAVAGERVAQLISRTEQRAFLRDERRRLRISTEGVEERKDALKVMRRTDWVPTSITEHNASKAKHIQINIGGLMFEAPVYILQRDPKSLLAQLCSKEPPVLADKDGFFYFDRDWWLFRYILTFLRDGTLPDDRNVLAQLYREASFWNLGEMHKAIEEEKLHLRSAPVGIQSEAEKKREKDMWWRKLPSWWQAVEEEQKKKAEEEKAKKKPEDWWKDSSYKGKTFLPLSNLPDKVTTAPGEKDAKPVLGLTWSASRHGEEDQYGYGTRSSYDHGRYDVRSSREYAAYNIPPTYYPRGSTSALPPPAYNTETSAAAAPAPAKESKPSSAASDLAALEI